MRRRNVLKTAAALSGPVLWTPGMHAQTSSSTTQPSSGHNDYFSRLNDWLRTSGPGRPVMLIDRVAMQHNVQQLVQSVGTDKTWRVVVKSLPSVPLLRETMTLGNTNALMVFHQPFLNEVARSFPDADILLGKPMPVAAVRTFFAQYNRERRRVRRAFVASRQIQWLIDSPERLLQYQQLARELGVQFKLNFELDVGLHRGGLTSPEQLHAALEVIAEDPTHLSMGGLMGYEPHLTGLKATLEHPAVKSVLGIYQSFVDVLTKHNYQPDQLTINGAGSHTLKIYEKDGLLNDLSAGSGVVMPTDFDTHHLLNHKPALFIATPILKRYDDNPYIPAPPQDLERLYYIYGGYWKAQMVSPANTGKPIYQSTNQSPITTSKQINLAVDDYMFLRPTQSEFVMLQFGDLLTVDGSGLGEFWPVFHQTG